MNPRPPAFSSGGTDSSTIAGMLTRACVASRRMPIRSGSKRRATTRWHTRDIAARHFGLAHHEYYVTPDDLVDAIPAVAASLDQPFGNSSVLPGYFCALRAREDGFTRMLAGDGGDELFGGNPVTRCKTLRALPRASSRSARKRILEPSPPIGRRSAARPDCGSSAAMSAMRARKCPTDSMHSTCSTSSAWTTVLDPEFRAHIDVEIADEATASDLADRSRAASLTNRMLEYDWKFTLADSDLPKVRAAAHSPI